MEPRLRGAAHVDLRPHDDVEAAQQVLPREPRGQGRQPLALAVAGDLRIVHPLRIDRHRHQIAHGAQELATHRAQVVACLDEPPRQIEHGTGGLVGNRLDDVQHRLAPDQAEHGGDVAHGDRLSGKRDHLVEGALCVAHAAVGGSRNDPEGLGVDRDRLGGGDLHELIGNRLPADRPELVHLRPRQDGVGDPAKLRRRHHENGVGRRLLDRFQQGVERVARELVHLVDDVHLVAVPDRGHGQAGNDHLPDVLDLGVRGGVDLEHVDVAALGDLAAGVARPARLGRRAFDAAQRPREDARRRGLSHAARTGEDERLGQPVARQGVPQGLRHAALAHDVLERLRAVLPGQHLVGHRGLDGPGARWAAAQPAASPTAARMDLRHMSVTT